MIKASEARFKSMHQKEINRILDNIEKEINKSISDGAVLCYVTIPVDTEQGVRNEIEKQMKSLGYTIIIPEKTDYIGPSDQAPYYDNVTICWE